MLLLFLELFKSKITNGKKLRVDDSLGENQRNKTNWFDIKFNLGNNTSQIVIAKKGIKEKRALEI